MVAPSKFAHVVFRTHRYEEMIGWYQRIFEARIQHQDQRLAFLTYDDEHHRFAFVNMGPATNGNEARRNDAPGVHHLAYTWRGLGELIDTYKRLKADGVLPWRPIRHGLTLSMYYQDPDGNNLEFQIDLMNAAEASAFMRTSAFNDNPIGEPFDPEALVARWDTGQPVNDLIFRSDQPELADVSNGAPAFVRDVRRAPASSAAPVVRSRAAADETKEAAAFLARIDAVLPQIRARAAEVEQRGRVHDETIAALTDAGMFRALQPRRWGGLEIAPAAFFEATIRVASACGSTGWVAGVVGVHPWQIALFPDAGQREVWGNDADARASSSYAPTGKVQRVPGGFRLAGRWGFSSGVDHCGWVLLGGVAPDDGTGAEFRTFLVPRADFTVDDASWEMSGLQGTGSKDVVLTDAFVPEHRTHAVADAFAGTDPGRAVNTAPLYRLPWHVMFAGAIGAPATGAALGALEAFIAQARTRISPRSGQAAALNPHLHRALAEASTIVGDARRRTAAIWEELHGLACAGQPLPLERRAQARYEAAYSAASCLRAVQALHEQGGGGTMATAGTFQRLLRDLMAMRNHPFAGPESRAGVWAKAMLGVEPEAFSKASVAGLV